MIGMANSVALASFIPICPIERPPTAKRVTSCGMVMSFSSRITMMGHKTSFQVVMNVMIPTVISGGTDTGQWAGKRMLN